jgi:hypothetical protein
MSMPDFAMSHSYFAAPQRPAPPPSGELTGKAGVKWNFLLSVAKYDDNIDDWRKRYGKEVGEARFFRERRPFETVERRGNMLLIAGASLIWECLIGNGGSGALQYLNSANAYIAVGDGGPTAGTGTVSVTNGSTTFTFSSSQTLTVGDYIQVTGDSTSAVYRIASGATTSWVMETGYGGTTGSGLAFTKIAGEVDTQTDLQATSNKTRQIVDGSFPYHQTSGGDNAITAATNATPIVITSTNSYSNLDFVEIQGVRGNTAANGLYQISSVTGTAFALNGSVGNGAYTSGGVSSKRKVLVLQSTFGAGVATHAWNEWGFVNASTGGSMLNRKVSGLGSKGAGASWAFKAAAGLA